MPDPSTRRDGEWAEHVVEPGEAGWTLEQILRGPMQVSRRMIQRLTRSGGLLLNRRPTFLSRKVSAGDHVSARVAGRERSTLPPLSMELSIVHEDEDLLAVDKPPFLLVHPTSARHSATLAHGVAYHLQRQGLEARVRPVHRIDRDTSGLVLFAKNAHAHHLLDLQLRAGEVERRYDAVAEGSVDPEAGVFSAPIGAHPRHPHLRAVRVQGGNPASTRYQVVERLKNATLLSLQLETGRTHQIRVHLSHSGHPLVGDREYGASRPGLLPRPALHSATLSFRHPASGRPLSLVAPLPEDLSRLVRELAVPPPPENP